MIYANADFMEYPWETLIKMFRRWLGKQSFATVNEYANSFFDYLLSQHTIFTEERQIEWFRRQALKILSLINQRFSEVVRSHIDQHGAIDDETIQILFRKMIDEVEPVFLQREILPIYRDTTRQNDSKTASSTIIDEVIREIFQDLPIQPF